MKFILTILLINFIFIKANNNSSNDTLIEEDFIGNIINDIDKLVSDIFDELDIQNEFESEIIIIEDEPKEIIIEYDDKVNEIEINGDLENLNEEESIWPERPVPKFKTIV